MGVWVLAAQQEAGEDPDHFLDPTPAEGSLYSATNTDFQASDPVIYRSLGPLPLLRTAKHDSKWLRGQWAWWVRLFLGNRGRGPT